MNAIRISGSASLLIGSFMMGCATTQFVPSQPHPISTIKLPEAAVELISETNEIESPAVSPDGRRVVLQILDYIHPWLPYEVSSIATAQLDDGGRWSPLEVVEGGIHRPYFGRMYLPVQPSFDETGQHLLLTHIEFSSGLGIPWLCTMRSWVEQIPWNGGAETQVVEHQDWGMRPTELLQHARVSPDGRWLVFYTREHLRDQGVHLLDLRSGQHYRLSEHNDKHPTWDPTGQRIYFHYAEGGRRRRFDLFSKGTERSVLGYFELQFDGDRLVGWKRQLMDAVDAGYIYQKHPTEVAGTGLLFFHGRIKPDDKMKLFVRAAHVGSRVYEVKLRWNGKKLKAAKHPCSSFERPDLVFIGKAKGEHEYRLLLSLTTRAFAIIQDAVSGGTP